VKLGLIASLARPGGNTTGINFFAQEVVGKRLGLLHQLGRERADALFVAADGFFVSRRVQFATLAARHAIPATYADRKDVEAGGLMSYGTDTADRLRWVGVYAGQILKGAKPADLPVIQSTKFVFAINLQTARALGLTVPPDLLSIADEVIE